MFAVLAFALGLLTGAIVGIIVATVAICRGIAAHVNKYHDERKAEIGAVLERLWTQETTRDTPGVN